MVEAAELIQAVTQAGGTLSAFGGTLRVEARAPLPDEMRAALRQHKPQVLEILMAHHQGDAPNEWREGIAKLISMAPPPGFTPERWGVVVNDAGSFLDRWATQAARLGWSAAEVFGCHRRAPAARYDAAGLVVMMNGDEIVALTDTAATIRNKRGVVLTHQRRLTAPEGEQVLIWRRGR